MSNVALICDAGPAVGLGHVMRCLTLAEALQDRGWTSHVFVPEGGRSLVDRLGSPPGGLLEFRVDRPLAPQLRAAPVRSPDLLVWDHYGMSADDDPELRHWPALTLTIDDLAARPHSTDVLLDPTFGRRPEAYRDLVPPTAQLLLGSAYALVRESFRARRAESLRRRLAEPSLRRVVISLGGHPDPRLVDRMVDAALAATETAVLDVMLGAADVGDRPPHPRVVWHRGRSDICRIMAEADLAIGGAGTSTWERCCLGLPSISIRLAENQSTIARNVAVAGAAVDLGDISSLDRLALVEAIRRLRDPPTRREMAAAAARICDGLGARRAVGHLIPERSADGRAVTLRPATEDDAKAMFEWQQDPAIRRFAHRPEPPTWQEHTEWLARRLAQPDAGLFSVVMSDRTPVGVVRLDGVDGEGESFVVNVFVDRAWQRRGIAAAALRACRRIIGAATLTAEVHPDNVASHRLFRRAGFSEPAPGRYRQSVAALGSAAERR